jgi:hypothetical protein
MPDTIPVGINRENLLQAISQFDAGVSHKFADSTAYDLLHGGKRYPPKAIVGIASEVLTGIPFAPRDFKGGLESKCFGILQENGFEIVPKIDAKQKRAKMSRTQFAESYGATCRNPHWSWSFVNHEKRFVIFAEWQSHLKEQQHPRKSPATHLPLNDHQRSRHGF